MSKYDVIMAAIIGMILLGCLCIMKGCYVESARINLEAAKAGFRQGPMLGVPGETPHYEKDVSK